MRSRKLTASRGSVTNLPMRGTVRDAWMRGEAGMALLAVATLGGCINVSAPDKPIVIQLNINIQQEVVYRLAEDAGNTIEENADIF